MTFIEQSEIQIVVLILSAGNFVINEGKSPKIPESAFLYYYITRDSNGNFAIRPECPCEHWYSNSVSKLSANAVAYGENHLRINNVYEGKEHQNLIS